MLERRDSRGSGIGRLALAGLLLALAGGAPAAERKAATPYSPYAGDTHPTRVDWGDAERRVPGTDGKLPPVGDPVHAARASWANRIGDPGLAALWTDPDFDSAQRAFDYAP